MTMTVKKLRAALRAAFAEYYYTEGCGCCQHDEHPAAREAIGALLKVKKHADRSGYDFYRYRKRRPAR